MTRRRQATKPVPLTPTHRRDCRTFWRRCTCGLTSPCVDRLVPATPLPFPPRTATAIHPSAGSHEERSPRYPTLIEYLATVPFPVHFGVAVLRAFPTEPPDSPKPSLPRAPADHPGGSGALGGPGSRPCPGFRAGAAPTPFPHASTIGHTTRRPKLWAANLTATRQPPETVGGDQSRKAKLSNGDQRRTGNQSKRPKAARGARREPVGAMDGTGSRSALAIGPGWSRDAVGAGGGDRAGERVGRPGAGDLRAGSYGGRRGRLPTFGGRPAMAFPSSNLSRR